VKKNRSTSELEQFRQSLYQNFNNRADTVMELVDALCSNIAARSPVELTLASYFRRTYSALYKAIDEFSWTSMQLVDLLAPYLPRPQQRPFWLLGVDVTAQPRPYAPTATDRGMVYQPTHVKGNKPVTVGHQYSTVALLPEAEANLSPSWLVPLTTQRVATTDDKELVGAAQIETLLSDRNLPFRNELCVDVGDSCYSKPAYLFANRRHHNLVTLARTRSNRTFYQRPLVHDEDKTLKKCGHPTWYGDAFRLQDSATWHAPDETITLSQMSRRGKHYRVEIRAWHHMLMRGKQKPKPLPMHRHPFTLVCIIRYDDEGQQVGKQPLWLIVIGERRHELSLSDSYHAYEQRYDLEHFFRFGKQRLLLTDFQTPETDREETWWRLVHLAYAQLWMARHVTRLLPRPWERNLPAMRERRISPTLVQRDFGRIIRQLGTPAKAPKPRGNSAGRPKGTKLAPRSRHKVVVKRLLKANSP
jgi:hypothetical protein